MHKCAQSHSGASSPIGIETGPHGSGGGQLNMLTSRSDSVASEAAKIEFELMVKLISFFALFSSVFSMPIDL